MLLEKYQDLIEKLKKPNKELLEDNEQKEKSIHNHAKVTV